MNYFLQNLISLFPKIRCRRSTTSISIGVAALLSACASSPPSRVTDANGKTDASPQITVPRPAPDEEALRELVALQDRLDRVAAPLLVNNAPLCKGNARHLLAKGTVVHIII